MENYQNYAELAKPSWAPPSWLFGPVWTVLYAIIAVTYISVGKMYFAKQIPFMVVLPFILNIIFNAAFTPLQFGLKNNMLAAIDIALVLGTIIWMMIAIWPHAKWVVYWNIPYLAWVSFATVLQFTVTWLNR